MSEPLLTLESADYVDLISKNQALMTIARKFFVPSGKDDEQSTGDKYFIHLATLFFSSSTFIFEFKKLLSNKSESLWHITEDDANFVTLYASAVIFWVLFATSTINKIENKGYKIYSRFVLTSDRGNILCVAVDKLSNEPERLKTCFKINGLFVGVEDREIDQLREYAKKIKTLDRNNLYGFINGWLPAFLHKFGCNYYFGQEKKAIISIFGLIKTLNRELAL